jgi:hypothetical protein
MIVLSRRQRGVRIPLGTTLLTRGFAYALWNPYRLAPQLPQRLFLTPVLGKGMMVGSSASRPNRTRVVIPVR